MRYVSLLRAYSQQQQRLDTARTKFENRSKLVVIVEDITPICPKRLPF